DLVTGVQTCALPIFRAGEARHRHWRRLFWLGGRRQDHYLGRRSELFPPASRFDQVCGAEGGKEGRREERRKKGRRRRQGRGEERQRRGQPRREKAREVQGTGKGR